MINTPEGNRIDPSVVGYLLQPEIEAAMQALGPAKPPEQHYPMPITVRSRDYQLNLRYPGHKTSRRRSQVVIVDVLKGEHGPLAAFVLRSQKDQPSTLPARSRQNSKLAALLTDYGPQQYSANDQLAWNAEECLRGVERYDLQKQLANDPFASQYAQQAVICMQRAIDTRVTLQDANFSDGLNCIANPQTGELKLIEPNNFTPLGPRQTPDQAFGLHLISELGVAANHDQAVRRFFFLFCYHAQQLPYWDQVADYMNRHLVQAVVDQDFNAFNTVVSEYTNPSTTGLPKA